MGGVLSVFICCGYSSGGFQQKKCIPWPLSKLEARNQGAVNEGRTPCAGAGENLPCLSQLLVGPGSPWQAVACEHVTPLPALRTAASLGLSVFSPLVMETTVMGLDLLALL